MWQRHSYGGPRRKTPKKFMHKQYKLYTRRHLLKISFEKIFQKIFRKNLSPLHLPPKLSPEEKSLSPRTQTRPLPDSNPPFPAPGPNPSSITPLIPPKSNKFFSKIQSESVYPVTGVGSVLLLSTFSEHSSPIPP